MNWAVTFTFSGEFKTSFNCSVDTSSEKLFGTLIFLNHAVLRSEYTEHLKITWCSFSTDVPSTQAGQNLRFSLILGLSKRPVSILIERFDSLVKAKYFRHIKGIGMLK